MEGLTVGSHVTVVRCYPAIIREKDLHDEIGRIVSFDEDGRVIVQFTTGTGSHGIRDVFAAPRVIGNCVDCVFNHKNTCHASPPDAARNPTVRDYIFRPVADDDWCGVFSPKVIT